MPQRTSAAPVCDAGGPVSISHDANLILRRVAEADADAWVVAIDEMGTFLFVNETYCRSFGRKSAELLGLNLALILPEPVARERIEFGRVVAETGQPAVHYEFIFGRLFRAVLVPLPRTGEGRLAWVVTIRPAGTPVPGNEEPIGARTPMLREPIFGFFENLTDRELGVLRLLATELSNDDIAARLRRSRRAVEWHVRGLMEKLGAESRVSLFRVGYEAGLHLVNDDDWREILKRRKPARRRSKA